MAYKVQDLLRAGLRKIGVLGPGEPLPPDEGQDALEILQLMVDAWALEKLLIPTVAEITIPLLAGVSEYTIGIYPEPQPVPLPDNHKETARPEEILAAFIRDGSGTDYIQEAIEVQTFSKISRKTNESRPSRFYVRQGWPLNTILFESVPYANETLHMSALQPLSGILPAAGLDEVIDLPPGYKNVLVYNYAVEAAPEWEKQVSPVIATLATEGKKRIKRANYRDIVLGMDRAISTKRDGKGTYIINQGP